MSRRADHQASGDTPQTGARRQIAGLRITRHDESLLAVVRPYLADAGSESELAYRLWRRGLEVTLAEVVGIGAALPPSMAEELLARLVAQRLILCVPLLRRTGTLTLLEINRESGEVRAAPHPQPPDPRPDDEAIVAGAAEAVVGMGGNDFL